MIDHGQNLFIADLAEIIVYLRGCGKVGARSLLGLQFHVFDMDMLLRMTGLRPAAFKQSVGGLMFDIAGLHRTSLAGVTAEDDFRLWRRRA